MGDAAGSMISPTPLSTNSVLRQYRKRSLPCFMDGGESLSYTVARSTSEAHYTPIAAVEKEEAAQPLALTRADGSEYSVREGSSPVITPANASVHSEDDRVIGEHSAMQFSSVEWERANYDMEQQDQKESVNAISAGNTGSNRHQSMSFSTAVQSLKSDTFAWEPYIPVHRINESRSSNCLVSLFYRCLCRPANSALVSRGRSGSDVDAKYIVRRDEDFTLTLSFVPFDHSHSVHRRLLVTIHNALIRPHAANNGSSRSSVMDWEKLGFQGSDPATDLRSTGIFGLVQLVYLIEYHKEFTDYLWEVCNPQEGSTMVDNMYENLPFVLIGFNFSAVVLESLKDTKLFSELRHRAESSQSISSHTVEDALSKEFPILKICCDYYVGCLFIFWEWWLKLKRQRDGRPPTVADFGIVKAQVCAKIKKMGAQAVLEARDKSKDASLLASLVSGENDGAVVDDYSGADLQFTSI